MAMWWLYAIWLYGYMATWLHGYMALLRHDYMPILLYGFMDFVPIHRWWSRCMSWSHMSSWTDRSDTKLVNSCSMIFKVIPHRCWIDLAALSSCPGAYPWSLILIFEKWHKRQLLHITLLRPPGSRPDLHGWCVAKPVLPMSNWAKARNNLVLWQTFPAGDGWLLLLQNWLSSHKTRKPGKFAACVSQFFVSKTIEGFKHVGTTREF